MPMINTPRLTIRISNLRFGAELKQRFVAIEHEVLIPRLQLHRERPLPGQGVLGIDRVFKTSIFVPFDAFVDEAVDDVGTERRERLRSFVDGVDELAGEEAVFAGRADSDPV